MQEKLSSLGARRLATLLTVGALATAGEAAAVSGPSWYSPWFWTGDRWVFRPYRYWWWDNQGFWQPGWRHGRWSYSYRRW